MEEILLYGEIGKTIRVLNSFYILACCVILATSAKMPMGAVIFFGCNYTPDCLRENITKSTQEITGFLGFYLPEPIFLDFSPNPRILLIFPDFPDFD